MTDAPSLPQPDPKLVEYYCKRVWQVYQQSSMTNEQSELVRAILADLRNQ